MRKGLLLFSLCLSSGCDLPEPDRCVPGFRDGVYAVDLIERNATGGSFPFDSTLAGTVGRSPPSCANRKSFLAAEQLIFRAQGTEANRSRTCSYHTAELVDPRAIGNSDSESRLGPSNWLFAARNDIQLVLACREEMVALGGASRPS